MAELRNLANLWKTFISQKIGFAWISRKTCVIAWIAKNFCANVWISSPLGDLNTWLLFLLFWKGCGSWLTINGYTFSVFHSIEHEGWLLLIFSWLMNYIPLMLDVFGKASVLRKSSKWNSPINNMKLLVLLRYSLWIIMHYELVVWCRFFHATFFLLLWYSMLTNQIFFEITNSNRVRIEDDVVILY